jgi:hypothetical protein
MGGRVLCELPLIEAGCQYVSILDQHRSYRNLLGSKGLMGHVQGHAHEMPITGRIGCGDDHINALRVMMTGLSKNSFSEWPKKW